MHAGAIPIVEVCGDETVHYLKAFPEAKELFEATLHWAQGQPSVLAHFSKALRATAESFPEQRCIGRKACPKAL